jgi:hypothetical protein
MSRQRKARKEDQIKNHDKIECLIGDDEGKRENRKESGGGERERDREKNTTIYYFFKI